MDVCAGGVASDVAFSGHPECGYGSGHRSGFLNDDCHLSHTEVIKISHVSCNTKNLLLIFVNYQRAISFCHN